MDNFVKQAQHFAALAEISGVLYDQTLRYEILQLVADMVTTIMEADVSLLYLTDERTGKLRLEVARGLAEKDLAKLHRGETLKKSGIQMVRFPLKFKDNNYGMLTVGRINRVWSENDLEVLDLLTRLVSGAINKNQFLYKMRKTYLETVKGFAMLIETRNYYAQGHSERVAALAVNLAGLLGLPEETLIDIEIAGILHDIGKIGIPEILLNKHAKLNQDEFEVIKKHPCIGASLVGSIQGLQKLVPYIQYHHERFDGSGYPDGLKGSQIPLEVQLISIADVYEALTSPRTYREALPTDEALKIIKDGSGKWFNPKLVETLETLIMAQRHKKPLAQSYPNKFSFNLSGPENHLTPREMEILALVGKGLTNKEIAQQLFIAERTVKSHLTSILRKLDLSDRTKAAIYAINQGITG